MNTFRAMRHEAEDLVMCCGPGERNPFRETEHMLSSLEATTSAFL